MSGLLRKLTKDDPLDRPKTETLRIQGKPYTNAAAKFWPSLLDEITEDHPECSLIELSAPTSKQLAREQLFPETELQKSFDELMTADMSDVMRDVVAELELLGPPVAVHARLFKGKKHIFTQDLPLDSVDSETFSYLVAWHLEWAGIPDEKWNDQSLSGRIRGDDEKRGLIYQMTFSLTTKHMSEGLYSRSLSVVPAVKPI